jgi:hypothetical protein
VLLPKRRRELQSHPSSNDERLEMAQEQKKRQPHLIGVAAFAGMNVSILGAPFLANIHSAPMRERRRSNQDGVLSTKRSRGDT